MLDIRLNARVVMDVKVCSQVKKEENAATKVPLVPRSSSHPW